MGELGNTNKTLIRHDYKRALYRALLSEFPPESIRRYFSRVPLEIEGRRFGEAELYEHLWKPKGKIPIWWDVGTDNELEPFLVAEGRVLSDVIQKVLWLNNRSSIMPGKVLLGWFYPRLETLFSSLDSRDIAFSLMTLHNENWVPGAFHRRIRKRVEGEWVHSVVILILDRTHQEYLDWDLESFGVPLLMAMPSILGMPPLERCGMLADTRPPGKVVWRPEDAPDWKGGILEIGGIPHGRKIAFGEFWRRLGLDLERFHPPESEVVEMTRDYFCPLRERIVLHAGCAYGSPFFIHTTSHRKLKYDTRGALGTMVGDLVREEEMQDDELEAKHLALMSAVSGQVRYRFHVADESISLNDRYLTKGVPARILKHLLETHLDEGRTEFEYRDLKRRFEITLGRKNANFEIRFARLVEKLASEPVGVRIEKTGRGRFRLARTGNLGFSCD